MTIPAYLGKPLFAKALKTVEALLLDVDGVLTTGGIVYGAPVGPDGPEGIFEVKTFSVKDGLGLRMLQMAGIKVAVVTGRASWALAARLDNLGLNPLHRFEKCSDKAAVMDELEDRLNVDRSRMAFLADDLPDIPLLRLVGVPIAVADAHPEVVARSTMVTRNPGGCGAVREVCEALIKACGKWETVTRSYEL